MSRSVGAVRKEGWSWVTLKAWNPRLSSLLAGSPLSSVFPSNSGDDQPLSLGVTGKSVKNKGSVCGVLCGAGPYKQPLSQYYVRDQHSDPSHQAVDGGIGWAVADGCFEEGMGCSYGSLISFSC